MPTIVRDERRSVAELSVQLAAIDTMTMGELAQKYRELYGEPTRSFNKGYLRKRLAFRIQELAHGGLPPRALERVRRLGDGMPERWRRREAALEQAVQAEVLTAFTPPSTAAATPETPPESRVLAVPVGTVLRRVWKRQTYEVVVCAEHFELEGKSYPSLFAVAKQITGTHWSGLAFFGLNKPRHAEASR